jgi:hypothetical protein
MWDSEALFAPMITTTRVPSGDSGLRMSTSRRVNDSATSLTDLTCPAVLAAIEEHDRLGRDEFLRRCGFGPARKYRLLFNGREYDSTAIAGGAPIHRAWGAAIDGSGVQRRRGHRNRRSRG